MNFQQKPFLQTKWLFNSTLIIIILVILSVWLSGANSHRSLFQNSIVSTSILGGAFFLFISMGLYFGLKLKDNVGPILHKDQIKKYSDNISLPRVFSFGSPDAGDGIGEIIFSIILWFLISIVITFLLYFLGFFFWASILFFAAMLYWIFFRALRLVFKNSKNCKGCFLKSFGFGFFTLFCTSLGFME